MFSRILFASDGSEDANRAAAYAATLAERFHARLHVLHVFPMLATSTALSAQDKTDDPERDVRQCVEHWAEQSESVVANRVAHALQQDGVPRVPYTFHQENGDPAATIVDVAARQDFDLVVMGCRGLGRALRHRLGSVSDWVTDHAHCPVLVIRTVHEEPGLQGTEQTDSSPNANAKNEP
jgi:nucleotide-binding universal stress UspA family protein